MKIHKTTCHSKGREGGKIVKCNRQTLVRSAVQQKVLPPYTETLLRQQSVFSVQALANSDSSGVGTRQSSIIRQQGVLSEALFPERHEWKCWPCSCALVTPRGTVLRQILFTAFYKCPCKCFTYHKYNLNTHTQNWRENSVAFPPGDAWSMSKVYSIHNFATAREVLVARATMLVAVPSWDTIWGLTHTLYCRHFGGIIPLYTTSSHNSATARAVLVARAAMLVTFATVFVAGLSPVRRL